MTTNHLARISRARRLGNGEGRRQREAAHVSIQEMAATLDVSAATLQRWEAGKHAPRTAAALRWLDSLEALAAETGAL